MLRTRWYKVLSDLWSNRTRTLLVSLAVAVGVYSVGSVLAVQALMLREFHSDRAGARIASAVLYTAPFDKTLAERFDTMPGIAAAEGRSTVNARVLVGPSRTRDIQLVALADFETMRVDTFPLVAGRWPVDKDEVMLEWMGLDYLGAQIGDTITVELSDDTRKQLTITGTAHNPQDPAPTIIGSTLGIVTPETMAYLGAPPLFTEMHVIVAGDRPNRATVQSKVDEVQDQIERSGREVFNTYIVGTSIIESIVNTAVMILSVFGWVILLLSAFLVINTISALIAQQVNQIGIMKLIGASRSQMMTMYIVTVLVYGIIALLIGIPLSVTVARLLMTQLIEGLVNIRTDSYAIPLWVYGVMIAVGLLIPAVAGLFPVWQGTRITTFAALNPLGIDTQMSAGWLDRMLIRLPRRWLQRPFLLAVRNSLRHKGRLLRTMIVMVLGTALFIAVISVRQSVDTTLSDFLLYHQYDVQVQFEEAHRMNRLEEAALEVPGVSAAEGWGLAGASRQRPDGTESNRFRVYGLPEKTALVEPIVQAGRWLRPQDEYAVVINTSLAEDEGDLQIGDSVVLEMDGRERVWEIVGIVKGDAQGAKIYMNYGIYSYETRTPGKVNSLQVITSRHGLSDQNRMEAALLNHFEAKGFDVQTTRSTQTLNDQNVLMFNVIVGFLILMAVLLGAVGSLGLSTTMSINMTERIREIGVLRAIGASNASIRWIVLMEGALIAILSWALGFVLSFPAAHFMSREIGLALLDMPLTYTYSYGAAVGWFFALLALAIMATLGPRAAQSG